MLPNWLFPRFRSLWYGLTLPVTALRLILARPSLLFWSALPVIITLALYFYIVSSFQDAAQAALLSYFQSWGWTSDSWIAWSAMLFSKILLIIVAALTFSFCATIAASPFNDFLAENTEKWATPTLPPVTESSWRLKARLVGVDIVKTIAATGGTIFAILFSWIPVLNFAAFVVAFLLVAFQYTSYPQTRRGVGVASGLRFLWKHLFACVGFGMAISGLFALPLISSLVLPLAVVGGTLLVARAPGSRTLPPLR